jgi:hypothetical protein
MTIKLMLLKSGEDLIADISEMVVGEEEQRRVVGYYLTKPCLVRMGNSNLLTEESEGSNKKAGFQVSLYPWMPLSADEQIPIPADWLVTMVEPTVKLKEMYLEDVINYGKQNDQSNSTDEQPNSNQSD